MSINSLAVNAVVDQKKDDTIAGLTKYIPTESITLYIALVSSQSALQSMVKWLSPHMAYWIFVGFTPALLLILYIIQNDLEKGWVKSISKWPVWRMVASMIAFMVWALAVPGNPIIPNDNASAGVVAGFAAIFVSTLLNLIDSLIRKIMKKQ